MSHFTSDNSTGTSVISSEEENYLLIAQLLVRVAPSAVRVKFNYEFYPDELKKILNQNRFTTLNSLKQQKVINQVQWDLLFPISGNASSEGFDLTLMICLIKSLTTIQVGDILQFYGDKSEGADLTRLKYYRNKIMHTDDGILSDTTFKNWWDQISQAIIRLGGASFEESCNHLKERKLGNEERDILMEIKNITGMLDPFPKGLRKLCEETVIEWKKEIVAETRAIRRLKEMTKIYSVAVAVGPSGCGKSTAIHFVALQLALKQGYEIIILHNPEDMRMIFNPDCKQVFVIDDVFSVATFNTNKANKWLEMSNDIKRILSGNQTKLLASCKTRIFQHRIAKTVSILSEFSCDFLSSVVLNMHEIFATGR